jgi:hypothetical protein
MELRAEEMDALGQYAAYYDCLIGDKRTARTFAEILKGIVGSESLCCARIAAFSPSAAGRVGLRGEAGAAVGERRRYAEI